MLLRPICLSTVLWMFCVPVSSTKEMYAYLLRGAKTPTLVDRLEGGEGTPTAGEGPRVLGRVEGGVAGGEDGADGTAAGAGEGAAEVLRPDEGVVPGGTGTAGEGEGLAGAGAGLEGEGAGEEGEAAGGWRDPVNISLGHGFWTAESFKVCCSLTLCLVIC